MDKNLKKLAEPGVRLHLVILVIFAAASLYFKLYELAAAEPGEAAFGLYRGDHL